MSNLTISGNTTSYTMNVIAFSSPIYGQINSAQTSSMAVHFPIKMAQPVYQMDVQFVSENEFESFQRFVRNHQQQISSNPNALLTINWPQRSVSNFTGFISQFPAGGMKANPAPRARFVLELVDSFVTSRTDIASMASNWRMIYGGTASDVVGLVSGGLSVGQNSLTNLPGIGALFGILTGTG